MTVTTWFDMSTPPGYAGDYDVMTDAGPIREAYRESKWQGEPANRLQWRGREPKLSRAEKLSLQVKLGRRCDSADARQEAAHAAVELARAAQASAATVGGKGASKIAVRPFHLAVGLGAKLDTPDVAYMEKWWPKLKAGPKAKVEREVQRFIAGKVVRFD